MPEPMTEAGKRLLDTHGHRPMTEPLEDDVWCAADDEPWPCPFSQAIAAIEAEARKGYVPESLSPEWHAELTLSDAEGYARGRAAALAEAVAAVEGLPEQQDSTVAACRDWAIAAIRKLGESR